MEEQVVEILQAVQEVTPEIASQAVTYGRWVNIAWLGVLLIVIAIAIKVFFYCKKHLIDVDFVGPAIFSSFVITLALLAGLAIATDLIGSYIAPDYYAAEAVIRMFRLGVH